MVTLGVLWTVFNISRSDLDCVDSNPFDDIDSFDFLSCSAGEELGLSFGGKVDKFVPISALVKIYEVLRTSTRHGDRDYNFSID